MSETKLTPVYKLRTQYIQEFKNLLQKADAESSKIKKEELFNQALDIMFDIERTNTRKKGLTTSSLYYGILNGFKHFTNTKNSKLKFYTSTIGVPEKIFNKFKEWLSSQQSRFPKEIKSIKERKPSQGFTRTDARHSKYNILSKLYHFDEMREELAQLKASKESPLKKADRITALENTMEEYREYFKNISKEINLDDLIKSVEENRDKKINEYNAEIQSAEETITKSKEQLDIHNKELENLEKELKDIPENEKNKIKTKKFEIYEKKGEIFDLNQNIEALNTSIKRFNREIESEKKKAERQIKNLPDFVKEYGKFSDIISEKPEEPKNNSGTSFKGTDEIYNKKYTYNNTLYPFYDELISTIKRIKNVIKENPNSNDIKDKILNEIEKIKTSEITSIISVQKIEDILNNIVSVFKKSTNSNSDSFFHNFEILKKIQSNPVLYFERGVKDYFFIHAASYIKKHHKNINPEQLKEIENLAKNKIENLGNNVFLVNVVPEHASTKFYKYLLKKKEKDLIQIKNLKTLKNISNEYYNGEETNKSLEQRASKLTPKKKAAKEKYRDILINLLNIMEPSDTNFILKERVKELKKHIEKFYLLLSISAKQAEEMKKEYEENKDNKITDDNKINELTDKMIMFSRKVKYDYDLKQKASDKLRSAEVDESKDGYVNFELKPIKQNKDLGYEIFNSKDKDGRIIEGDYISTVQRKYPPSIYEYVDYKPLLYKEVIAKNLMNSSGKTLALYDENYDLISDGRYRKAKYVKLKNYK